MTHEIGATFADLGLIHITNLFRQYKIDGFERQIIALYAMQARKIGEYRSEVDAILADQDLNNLSRLSKILLLMEASDKDAAYQVQKFLPRCQSLRALFDDRFMALCAGLLQTHERNLLLDGPALFVNMPTVQRLLYKWHSEALYYPKRRRFLNVWMPVFGPRTEENGAMSVLPHSHKRVWDASMMSEYTGYNKDSENKKNHFVQYEIPQNFLADYSIVHCTADQGDVIFFDRNLVHTSNANTSSAPAYAVVCRVWDPSDDLTLSGNMEATPYGGNTGRANLVVRP